MTQTGLMQEHFADAKEDWEHTLVVGEHGATILVLVQTRVSSSCPRALSSTSKKRSTAFAPKPARVDELSQTSSRTAQAAALTISVDDVYQIFTTITYAQVLEQFLFESALRPVVQRIVKVVAHASTQT